MVLIVAFTPRAAADETSNVTGKDVTRTLKQNTPKWEEVLNPQLVRRDEQERQRAEEAKQAELNAQAEQQRQAQAVAQPTPTPVQGGREDWMLAAGIPQSEWGYVNSIVTRESGWNPNAVNRSSGACGLGQQLPCGKWAGAWNDPVAALIAMTGYVTSRYGGWAGAVAFWNSHGWY